jgi:hypothetical protein
MIPITAVLRSGLSAAIAAPVPVITSMETKNAVPVRPCHFDPLRTASAPAPASSAMLPATTWMNNVAVTRLSLRLSMTTRIMWIEHLCP